MDRFTYKIFQFSIDNQLIEPQDKVIISLSGGIDSMSLFCILNAFREKIDLDLHLVHFHHGLRMESQEEAEFIRNLAKEKNVSFSIIKTNHLKGEKGMQNKARQWRYSHLNKKLKSLNFNKIALGHHLNDLMETQIWKMVRGGSLFSLNPMQIKNLPYIRPLLNTPKNELQDYLEKIGQEWRDDLSNLSDDYTRNLIRNQIVPLLRQCSGGQLEEKFLALNKDSAYLKQYFDQLIPATMYQSDTIAYKKINQLNPLLACELIHQFLVFHDQPEINRDNIQTIFRLVQSNRGNWKVQLKNNRQIIGKNKEIKIEKS